MARGGASVKLTISPTAGRALFRDGMAPVVVARTPGTAHVSSLVSDFSIDAAVRRTSVVMDHSAQRVRLVEKRRRRQQRADRAAMADASATVVGRPIPEIAAVVSTARERLAPRITRLLVSETTPAVEALQHGRGGKARRVVLAEAIVACRALIDAEVERTQVAEQRLSMLTRELAEQQHTGFHS